MQQRIKRQIEEARRKFERELQRQIDYEVFKMKARLRSQGVRC